MAETTFETLDELRAGVGRDLGTSEWVELTREQLDRFAEATGTPTDGSGTAPPLLLLALTNQFLPRIVEVRGVSAGINYGTGEVRFPATAHAGQRMRGRARLVACDDIPGGVQTTMRVSVEVEVEAGGVAEPACVVDALSRWLA